MNKVDVSVYDRNRRETIEAGTLEVSFLQSVRDRSAEVVRQAEQIGRERVMEGYENFHGQITFQSYEIRYIWMSAQMMTVLRVWP